MKITQTNGNKINGIKGSRLRVWDRNGNLVGEVEANAHNAKKYVEKYPTGKVAKELARLIEIAGKV